MNYVALIILIGIVIFSFVNYFRIELKGFDDIERDDTSPKNF